MTTRFAFYGRVSTEDNQDPEASRAWQLSRARALIEPRGGEIVVEFFDVDKSRSIPWARRPHAKALLDELKVPHRGFEAVVIGEPHRAFYGNQYGLTFPIFEHFKIALWVPEVGGPIDPNNEAHDMIMGVFGGLSKGERNRVRIRVRAAMAAITATEGRYLGGRPPYGYRLVDAGPHPNPGKAADGKRLQKLEADPVTSLVVKWIFDQYIKGRGLFDLAEELTRQNISSPSASDPARNTHRCQLAWSKSAIRAIITNPRYTGRQVWNKQRKDEVLLDVEDIGLGHTTKMRWNGQEQWVWSEHQAHDAIIPVEQYEQVQEILAARRRNGGVRRKPRRTTRPYIFRGVVHCGICGRKMQGSWNNDAVYYRCVFPQQYALAGQVEHPKAVYVREDKILPEVDAWLAAIFDPGRINATIEIIVKQAGEESEEPHAQLKKKMAACDRQLRQYRAALDAGADPTEVAEWINTTKQERARLEGERATAPRRSAASREEIATLLRRLGDLTQMIASAEPTDKQELYRELGLRLTYQPDQQIIQATVDLEGRATSPSATALLIQGKAVSTDLRLPPRR